MTEGETPLFDQQVTEANQAAREVFFSDPDVAARQAQVDALVARLLDPDDEYDAHHGTDRSPESLALAREQDPATYARVLGKIERGD